MIEAALLLCLIATVLAVFLPTFVDRVRTNKINEATELLRELSDRTSAYYATTWAPGRLHCLPPAAGPTPATPTEDAAPVDFFAPDAAGHASWRALEFQPARPIRFSYELALERDGCGLGESDPETVVLRASGDLDGDGVRSTFERRPTLGPDGFVEAEALLVHQRTE